MNSSGILKVVLVILAIVLIAGLVYYFGFSPDKKYDRLINEANSLYEEASYEDAKKLYSEALQVREGETFPRKRILTIDSIQQQLELDIRYDEKINKADLLYSQGEYMEASQYYFDALNIKENEDYPVEQIKKIQEKLKEDGKGDKPENSLPKKEKNNIARTQNRTSDGNNFHVVVGVFENHTNAMKMQEQMKKMGKKSQIIPRPGNLEAVTFGSYDNIHTAYNFLKFVINDINEEAWVLYHETK